MLTASPVVVFPVQEVETRLRRELEKVAGEASLLRPPWEPLLDSKRVVGTVLVIEDLFPTCKISPDQVVRKGGYASVDEALGDIVRRLGRIVAKHNQKKGHV